MSARKIPQLISELERRVLSALCAGTMGQERKKLLTELGSYVWQDLEHWILFEALLDCSDSNPKSLRELLPAHLTRKGFPDLDWNNYLAATESRPGEVMKWVARLKTLSAEARH